VASHSLSVLRSRGEGADAGVLEDSIDAAVVGGDGVDRGPDRPLLGDVESEDVGVQALGLDQPAERRSRSGTRMVV
jgi:hypothetical protein